MTERSIFDKAAWLDLHYRKESDEIKALKKRLLEYESTKNASDKGKSPPEIDARTADTVTKNTETLAEAKVSQLSIDNNVNMETEETGHTAKRIEKLFEEALKDIKIQVQAPDGYALFPEPEKPKPIPSYNIEESDSNSDIDE